jgi:hypothetical protein
VRAGAGDVAQFAAAVRATLGDAVYSAWPSRKADAVAASRLLDAANEGLAEIEGSGVETPTTSARPRPTSLAAVSAFWAVDAPPSSLLDLLALGAVRGGGPPPAVAKRDRTRERARKRDRRGGRRAPAAPRPAGVPAFVSDLPPPLASEIAWMLEAVTARGDPPPRAEPVAPKGSARARAACEAAADALRATHSAEAVRVLNVDLTPVAEGLRQGAYDDVEALCTDVAAAARAAAEAAADAASLDVRRGKLLGTAEAFAHALTGAVSELVQEHGPSPDERAAAASAAVAAYEADAAANAAVIPGRGVPLPPAIAANFEPFFHGPWRRRPYAPRPYVKLTAYEAAPEVAWKLTTTKSAQCDGQHCVTVGGLGTYRLELEKFDTHCACLARNCECGPACGCPPDACANRAVTRRQPLVPGVDVREVHAWGVDCYTRRNVVDAVLESQAFGPHAPPDYRAMAAAAEAAAAAMARGEAIRRDDGGGGGSRPGSAAAADPAREGATAWVERVLYPAVNRQGCAGWDLGAALAQVAAAAESSGDAAASTAAAAVGARLEVVGPDFFRVHPKGVGMVCVREGGLPPLTFVEEYLGVVHAPWRWFEIQDAIKKVSRDELPDFYNIVLERPRDDPAGYDCLFVDAASKGAFASRMSHSCTPNCQAVVMACGGRLTIAVYTLRHVHEGEELTFDYASVTESEKEFREAICLCGTAACRGSFLTYSGSRSFQAVMSERHGVLARQAVIVRAGDAEVTDEDRGILAEFGVGDAALGRPGTPDRVPAWLEKWAALVLRFVKEERERLPAALLALPPALGVYNQTAAELEARGVADSRLQNVVITVDKVKFCLRQSGAPASSPAPVRRLSDADIVDHLWRGPKSIARRLLRAAAGPLSNASVSRAVAAATTAGDVRRALERNPGFPALERLAEAVLQPAADADDARAKLSGLSAMLRELDAAAGGGHTAAADLIALYAATRVWFFADRSFASFTSSPVQLSTADLGGGGGSGEADLEPLEGEAAAEMEAAAQQVAAPPTHPPARGSTRTGLAKKYGPWFIWGQMSGWFKQTVYDPTASLSAERRGTISLPDVESAYGGSRARYQAKDRDAMLEHIEKRPDAMWKVGTLWSFKNEAKIYGSPVFDSRWAELTGEFGDPMPGLVGGLRSAWVPYGAVKGGGRPSAVAVPPAPAAAVPAPPPPPPLPLPTGDLLLEPMDVGLDLGAEGLAGE